MYFVDFRKVVIELGAIDDLGLVKCTWSILRGLNFKASIHIINRMFIEF